MTKEDYKMLIMEYDIQVDRNGIIRKCKQTPVTGCGREEATPAVDWSAVVPVIETKKNKLSLAEQLFVRVNAIPFSKILGVSIALLGVAALLAGIGDMGLLMMAFGVGTAFSPLMAKFADGEIIQEADREDSDSVYSQKNNTSTVYERPMC